MKKPKSPLRRAGALVLGAAIVSVTLVGLAVPASAVDLGTVTLLYILIGTSLLGAFMTWRFGIETAGLNLETIGQDPPAVIEARAQLSVTAD